MREREIFDAALAIANPTERSAYLAEVCAGNGGLREHIEELLDMHRQLGSFLEAPASSPVATLEEPLIERPGTVIGPYKLLEQIGEGGFGLVFMAEQQQPLRRKVALKVIKPGMDSKQVIGRFEAERQALALMDHPSIARVLDAGTTDTGRPYFIMELVKGIPITQFCDDNRLTTRERLELFVQVCQAVQHAHQKGIIHRDLKPCNVLVTLHDGTPVPKVIDFGIAKAMGQQLTDKTLFTGFAQMVGTPLYMSPEQAGLSGLDIDTRSDLYSLGVLLYELLTGTTPFDKDRLQRSAYEEMLRIIREEEPPRPSTRITTQGQAAAETVSTQRQSDPKRLSRLLAGELDWIVMKTLEKDRNRRYESASALAADVQRHLNQEPVQACPPSVGYRLKKFARRNKGRLAVGACGLVVLAILAANLGWNLRDWQTRRTEAEARVLEALEVAEPKLREGNPWDPELISAVRKAEAQLASGVVREELRQQVEQLLADVAMLAKLEEIRLDQAGGNRDEFEGSRADPAYAKAFQEYGIDVEALEIPEAAAQIHQRAIRTHLAEALDAWSMARRLREKKGTNKNLANHERIGWKQLLRVAQAADPDPWRGLLRDALANDKWDSENLTKLVASAPFAELAPATLAMLGDALRRSKAFQAAEDVLRKGQQRYQADFWINLWLGIVLHQDQPSPLRLEEAIGFLRAALAVRPQSPGAYNTLGNALRDKGQWDDAIACYRDALQFNKDKDLYAVRGIRNNLCQALIHKGRLDDAIAWCREAIRLDADDTFAHYNLGIALQSKGQREDAIACYRKYIELPKDDQDDTGAVAHLNLGYALQEKGQLDQAIACYREAIRLKKDDVRGRKHEAMAHTNLADALRIKGQLDESIAHCREAIRLDMDLAPAHTNLGAALREKGQLDEAIAEYRAAIEIKKDYAEGHAALGTALQSKGDLDGAIAEYRKAIEIKPDFAPPHNVLGQALATKGQPNESIACFQKFIELKKDAPDGYYDLGIALATNRQWAEAQAAFRKALELAPNDPHCNGNFAAFLADCADVKFRDVPQAVVLAKKAVAAAPQAGIFWSTLGTAYYRAGQWKDAVAALEKSMKLQSGGDSSQGFFLAMTYQRLGDPGKARDWYDRAVQWMDKNKPQDEELRRYRVEAAALLGIKEPPIPKGRAGSSLND
jgi:serine/threonine-protein kinase